MGYLGLSLGFGSPPSLASNGGGTAGPDADAVGADIVAFLMIAVYSYRSAQMVKTSGLFGRVVQDATVYFLVVVWAHLTVTIYTSRMGDMSFGPSSPAFSFLVSGAGILSVLFWATLAACSPAIPLYVSSVG